MQQGHQINPFYHAPKPPIIHNKDCQPIGDNCNFTTLKQKSLVFVNKIPDEVQSLFQSNNLQYIKEISKICTKKWLKQLVREDMVKILTSLSNVNTSSKNTLLTKCLHILSKSGKLSKHLVSKVYQMLLIYRETVKDNMSNYFSNFDIPKDLPFGELVAAKSNQKVIDAKTLIPSKFLIDTGSNILLIPYNIFSSWGFSENQLMEVSNNKTQSSTGENEIILGQIKLSFFIRTTEGFCKSKEYNCMVTNPDYNLDFVIIGGMLLKDINLKLELSQKFMKASCQLTNRNGQIKECNLFLYNNHRPFVYCRNINQGDNECRLTFLNTCYATYYLKQKDNDVELKLPLIDLNHFNQVYIGEDSWPILSEPSTFSISVPLLQPAKEKVENVQLMSQCVYFTKDKVPCPEVKNNSLSPVKNSCSSPKQEESNPRDRESSSQCQENILSPEKMCQESSNSNPQDLNRMFSPENEGNVNFSENMIEKISFNTKDLESVGRSENKFNFKQFGSHLDGKNQTLLSQTLNKYEKLYAKSKFDIGNFLGFQAKIDVKDGATAVQKERRISAHYCNGVRGTMDQLTKNGVFALSDSGQNEFCCNLNIVPKITGKDEIRSNAKADKHIRKMEAKKDAGSESTSFRCTFDLKNLNAITVNNGRLQLPTIDEMRVFVRDKLCSTIDLVNQFYSIKLEPGSRKYTNFYYDGKIFFHKRMPMGYVNAPYIAAKSMNWTFSDDVFRRFLQKRGLTKDDIPYNSYREFVLIYLDDIAIASATSSNNSSFDKYKLHSLCLEAVLFALQEAGWLIGLKKCEFMTQSFVFLGQRFNTIENSTGLNSNRIDAILEWRSPRSIAEIESRLSIMSYFCTKIPGLRLIALPLIAVIRSKVFKWGLLEEKTFRNLKFLIALQIKNYNFNPDYKLILTNDASKVAISSALFQLNPNTGLLELLDTQTKLLDEAQRNYPPVRRENMALFFGISKSEAYIRNSNSETLILGDFSSIQWLMRTRHYNSRSYEQALVLSSLPNVSLYYTSGKSLLISDQLTRQFQDVFLKDGGCLSSIQSTFVPPLSKYKIPELSKLSNEQLVDYILSDPQPEGLIDVYDRKHLYHQNVHQSHVTSFQLQVSNEQQLLSALKLGFNTPETLNLPIFNDILKSQKNMSKTAQDFIVKNYNMQKLKTKIEQLDLNPELFSQILRKYRNPVLNRPNSQNNESDSSVKSNFENTLTSPPPPGSFSSYQTRIAEYCSCCHCKSLTNKISMSNKLLQLMINNDILTNFISSAIQVLPQLKEYDIDLLLFSKNETKCKKAKLMYDVLLMEKIFSCLDKFKFSVTSESNVASQAAQSTVMDVVTFSMNKSDNYYCTTDNNCIIVKTCHNILLQPLELYYVNASIKLFFDKEYSIQEIQDSVFLPKVSHFGPFFSLLGGNLLNAKEGTLEIKANQELFRIKLGHNDSNIILIGVEMKNIDNRFQLAEEIDLSQTQNNLLSVMSTSINIHNKKPHNIDAKQLSSQLNYLCVKAKVPKDNIQAIQKSKSVCFLNRQKNILNNLLLGSSLAKSNGIFNTELLAKEQALDYLNIFESLKDINSPHHENFLIKKGCLYKKSIIFGNVHLRLVLSDNLTKDIVNRLHCQKNFHISNGKLTALFNQTFFNKNISKWVKSAQLGCLVCKFYKRIHKRKISGDKRTFNQGKPGENFTCDIGYMNKSNKGHKYLLIFVDNASGYIISYPLKNLDARSCAEKLSQFLCHFPAPNSLSCDGDHVFGSEFLALATQHGILLRTAVLRRSQGQSTAEKGIRDYRNLLQKIIATNGRDKWCEFLSLTSQIYNCVAPYNMPMSKAALFLGPIYFHKYFALIAKDFTCDLFSSQQQALNHLGQKRAKALEKLFNNIGNCKQDLKVGSICTDEFSKDDLETLNGSRALLPTAKNVYKILEFFPNKLSVKIKNLKNGTILNKSIQHLRRIKVEEIADITLNLNPEQMFKEVPEARKNIMNISTEVVTEDDLQYPNNENSNHTLRSGSVYLVQQKEQKLEIKSLKPILKKTKQVPLRVKLEFIDDSTLEAVKNALWLKRSLYGLNSQEIELLRFKVLNSLNRYNIPNKVNKSKSKKKVQFTINSNNDKSSCSLMTYLCKLHDIFSF